MVILVPLCSICQTLEEFKTYFDNKQNPDEIEGIYTATWLHKGNLHDTYNNTNEITNKQEDKVIAIKGNSNRFYFYSLDNETNLFKISNGHYPKKCVSCFIN